MKKWDKEELIAKAKDLVNIVESKEYLIGAKKVDIKELLEKSFDGAYILSANERLLDKQIKRDKQGKVVLWELSTMGAYDRVKGTDNKVGILNFASATKPCGGFLNGVFTQEESLAYCTDMYSTLRKFQESYYDENKKDIHNGLYTDNMIISPSSLVVKDEDLNEVNPTIACIVTSPAVNRGVAIERGVSENEIRQVMRKRIERILAVFVHEGCNEIIVGAYGCGVFKNNPIVIANIFNELLQRGLYKKYFDRVIFAIPGGENYKEFKRIISVKVIG